jgi:hypothetical protein
MNYSVLFVSHLVGSAIGKERVILAELLCVSGFFRVRPARVIGIGEGHAHVSCGIVHEVANRIGTILRIGFELAIRPEGSGGHQPPSPDQTITRTRFSMRRTNICAVLRKGYDARRKEKEKQQPRFSWTLL